jgi:predicted lipoprotein
MRFIYSVFGISFLLGMVSCAPMKDPCAGDFDQTALLSNIAENIISPSYDSLQVNVNLLLQKSQIFTNQPNATNLDSVRHYFLASYKAFQTASILELGPAETYQLRSSLNNFPVFVSRLEFASQNNITELDKDSFSYSRGFPALDYLLFFGGTNAVLDSFQNSVFANNRKSYLNQICSHIKIKTDAVCNEWQSYKQVFVENTGLANGSSIHLLVNQLSQNMEIFKNQKLGNPIGAKVSYIPSPEKVESYYGGYSLELSKISISSMQDIYLGKTGIGIDDFVAQKGQRKENLLLEVLINNQFSSIKNQLDALSSSNLSTAINAEFTTLKTIYGLSVNHIVYLKTDIPSVLCVSISYADQTDDGD